MPQEVHTQDNRKYKKIARDEDALVQQIHSDYKEALSVTEDWRDEVRDLYDLVAGDQWDEISRTKMEDELRPIVTFNIAVKYLDAVGGLEIGNRQEVRYLPRELGDAGVNELLTNAAKWVRDECDAADEESEAFLDMVLGGMGWTETFIDTDEDPEGTIRIERRDPLEMFWDKSARKRNLDDTRWRLRVRPTDMEEVAERWPDKVDELLLPSSHAVSGIKIDDIAVNSMHDATNAWRYLPGAVSGTEGQTDTLPLVDYQWWTYETSYQIRTQQRGDEVVNGKVWKRMKEFLDLNGVPYEVEPFQTRKYYRAITVGKTVLETGESPYQEGFTYTCMTGRRDRNQNTWFALGRVLRDPQLWLNKFFSQILHTLNSNSKGGVMAVREAFENPSKAESEWAKPDAITWLDKTSDEHGNPTVVPKPMVPYPEGMDRLMMFTVNSLPNMTGLNLELLGLANKVQPGIVESQRKQAGMTMIQWAFDSKKRYTKDQGKMLAYYIREYISDGRLVRIDGELGEQFAPLLRDDETDNYDVIVDEAPTSPNNKERVWAMLVEMMPAMLQHGLPVPPDVLDYMPLPASLALKWKEMAVKAMGQQDDPQAQQQQQQMQQMMQQMAMQTHQAETAKTQAEAQDEQASAVLKQAQAQDEQASAGLKQAQTRSEAVSMQEQGASALLKRAQAAKTRSDMGKVAAETGKMLGGG